MNPYYTEGPTCEECHKYVYNDTLNTKLRCIHKICKTCAPGKSRRCPICKDGTLWDCFALTCMR